MRFGKTFTTYQLAKKMGWTKILVLTFKPAVKNSWESDTINKMSEIPESAPSQGRRGAGRVAFVGSAGQ